MSDAVNTPELSSETADLDFDAWLNSDETVENNPIKEEDFDWTKEEEKSEENEEENEDQEIEETEEKPEPKKEVPQTIKFKVDGEEQEVDIKDVPALLSKAAGADKRFQEAAHIRKEATKFVQFIKSNPIEALQRAGHDFEQLAIDHVHELIQIQNMSPEQREAHEAKKELARLKKEKEENETLTKKQREEQERIELEQATAQAQEAIEQEIIEAFTLNEEIPRNQLAADRFIYYMQMALSQGHSVTAKDVAHLVKKDFEGMIRQQKVNNFKQKQAVKPEPKKKEQPKGKRLTSIYDLME